jgi:hypothetical protein
MQENDYRKYHLEGKTSNRCSIHEDTRGRSVDVCVECRRGEDLVYSYQDAKLMKRPLERKKTISYVDTESENLSRAKMPRSRAGAGAAAAAALRLRKPSRQVRDSSLSLFLMRFREPKAAKAQLQAV